MSKARNLANLLSDGSSLADGVVAASEVTGLSTVATSGSFTDLSNQPSPFDPSTLATVATSGAYSALSGTPTLSTVATSGAYSSLSGKPSLGTASTQATGAFATAAQGTKADDALPKAGGAVTGDVTFGDNDKAVFGAGSDLQIYHNGSHSYIRDTGAGGLKIDASELYISNAASNESMIHAISNNAVTLFHNNASKLATTSTGCDITGTLNADALTGIGSIDATTAAAIEAAGVGGGGVEGLYSWQVVNMAASLSATSGPHTIDTNGNTVIVCGSGGQIARSTNNGLSWYKYQAASTAVVKLVFYNSDLSQWVISDADGRIYTSSNDGASFTQRRSHVGFQAIVDMVWTGSKYVGVARGHASVSTDGISWTNYAIGNGDISAYYDHIAYDGTKFVTSENYYASGQYYVYSSTNGTSWTRGQNIVTAISSLAYGNGVFSLLTGQKDCYTSSNGTSWTKRADTGIGMYNAKWGGEYFVGSFDTSIAYSSDGISWYGQDIPSNGAAAGYSYNSTRHFFHHTSGTIALSDK